MNKSDLIKPEDVISAIEHYIDAIKTGEIDFPSANAFIEALEYCAKLGRDVLKQKIRDFNRTAAENDCRLRRRRLAASGRAGGI